MGAIVKACSITNTPKNTGKQCDTAMTATAMLIAMQRGLKFTDADLADPVDWLTLLIHQKKAFPIFGQTAPIREINNNKAEDIIVELDDGLQVFLRYSLYNRAFGTTSGGLCYAEALASFLNSGYDMVEIDQQGQMLARKNEDGTYSPLITDFLKPMSPTLPDFKNTPYKNHFGYSFSPVELVNNGIIFKGASALLSMMGLIDAKILKAAVTTQSGFTAATGSRTITALGVDGNTIDYKVLGVSISGGPVTKTSAETTVTLLAAKIAAAITAAVATNGGYTAVNVAGAVNITAPSGLGATINTVGTTTTIVGTIAADTASNFSGGVTGTTKLKILVKSTCSEENLITKFGNALGTHTNNFSVQDVANLGTEVAPTSAAIVSSNIELSGPYITGKTYRVVGTSPETWFNNLVEGYDGSAEYIDILVS